MYNLDILVTKNLMSTLPTLRGVFEVLALPVPYSYLDLVFRQLM